MPVVDLRFVVHKREDIDLATKSLVAFNKVSYLRQTNYDAEAAAAKRGMTATTKLTSLERKLNKQRDIETKLVKEGLMAKKEQIALSDRYDRILEQETRTLQDYIDTDRVLQREQKDAAKSEEALGKQRTKTKNETEKLRRTYDSTYSATAKYKQGLLDIDRAFEGMEDGAGRAERAIKALKSDYEAFIAASKSGGIVDAGNQFARYGDQAYRAQQRTKRFASVGLQQAGYQVNDFIVQIASGQNALVAFGQQGSQLAGIFGTAGAVVGAVLAAAAALGNLIYQTYKATNDTRDFAEVLDDLKDSIETLVDSMEPLDMKDLGEQYGSMAGSMARMADSVRDLNAALAESDFKASLKEYAKESEGSVMSVIDDFIGLSAATKRVMDISPALLALLAPRAVRAAAIAGEEAGKNYAENLAKGFGAGVKPADVEKYFQQLLLAEQSGTAGDAARTIEEFEEKIRKSTSGFDTLTMSGQKFVKKMQELRREYSELQSALDGSGQLQASQNRSNEASAKAVAAARKKAAKLQADIQKHLAKIAKAAAKLAADQLKAAKRLLAAQEKAAEGGAKVQLKYQNAVLAASAKLAKAEGKRASAQTQEEALAAKMAGEQVKAQYESLRLKNGQLQLTAQQTVEMDKQVRLAKAAATQAVVLKYEAKTAAERIAEGAKNARELATQIERAAKAYETFLNKTNNINDNTAGIRKQIEILRKGGSTQDASAEGKNETAMRKVQREADELRAQQKALGPDRTLTDTEITASQLAQEKALGRNLAATKLKNKELDKRKKPKALPKTAKDILDKEERSMDLKLDKSRALLGLSETEILYETKKYALMSKVQEQMVTMTDAEKASTMARIDGIAREMAAREEQQRLEQEVIDFQKELAETISSTFADNFMSIVDGTKSVAEAFKAMAADIVKHLFKVLIIQTMIRAMGGFMGSVAAPDSLMGNIGKGLMSYEAADGGVLNNGQVVPYANGGVVGGPTTFPMSGGHTGLMGEAGPEAIMPLKRGKDGKLGVQADGGSSSSVVIHQSFNFSANGDESVKKIIAEQAPAIANMTKQNILNDRRRGGQMRQAFG